MFLFSLSAFLFVAQPLQFSFFPEGTAAIYGSAYLSDGRALTTPIVVTLRYGNQVLRSTLTDGSGQFVFHSIPPGSYILHVNETGFVQAEQAIEITAGSRTVQLVLAHSNTRPGHFSTRTAGEVIDVRQLAIPSKAVRELERAQAEIQKEKTPAAIERLKSALRIAPAYYEAHWQLGMQYLKSNKLADAETELIRAAELNPRTADPLVPLGLCYLASRKPADAVEVLERAVDLNPASVRGTYYLGLALSMTGNFARAGKMLERVIHLDGSLHSARLALADVYVARGKREQAVAQLQIYLSQQRNPPHRAAAARLLDQLEDRTAN